MRLVYVRCPTCNKVIANKEQIYQDMLKSNFSRKDALDALELDICCRVRMLGHVDLAKDMLEQKYYNFINPLTPPPQTSSITQFPFISQSRQDPNPNIFGNNNDDSSTSHLFDYGDDNVKII